MENLVIPADFVRVDSTVLRKIGNSRKENDAARGRRHLTHKEVQGICRVIQRRSRYPDRDELMVLTAFHHGYRISELLNLKWQHINLKTHQITVKRLKNGIDTQHPIADKRELMLLRRQHKAQGKPTNGYVFLNERGASVSVDGFRKMFGKFSKEATGILWNPHALRHGCGTALIEKGHDVRMVQVYLGHKNIQNTTVYLHESGRQFAEVEW